MSPNAGTFWYDRAGKCIYCHRKTYNGPGTRTALGDEHVIAGGLGTDIVIPHASCHKHEEHTSGLESKLIHNLFDPPRRHFWPRRRKPFRKSHYTLSHRVGESDIRLQLPIAVHPTVLFLPQLGPPGILCGRPKDLSGVVAVWLANINVDETNLRAEGIEELITPVVDTVLFTQVLCKIAHAFATAELRDTFCPLLPSYICKKIGDNATDDRRYHFVGGDGAFREPSEAHHELSLFFSEQSGTLYVVAQIRLFAFMGTPVYSVVAGTVPDDKLATATARLHSNNSRKQER